MLPEEEGPGVDPCLERRQSRYDASLKAVLYSSAFAENIPGCVPSRRLMVCILDPSRTVDMEDGEQQAALVVDPSG